MTDFARAREKMVETHLAARGIHDLRLLDAMLQVPREMFVEPELRGRAYADEPLPIEKGQSISQPYIVAFMIQSAELKPADRVLEIGSGSGYTAAVTSRLVSRVYGIERLDSLLEQARKRLAALSFDNIELRSGDGCYGWPEAAPFDAILVAASANSIPEPLQQQLAIGGRLVMPVYTNRGLYSQALYKLTRVNATQYRTLDLGPVAFVPLISTETKTG